MRAAALWRTTVLALAAAAPAGAQSVRVSGVTTVRYVELRPLVRDSVAETEVPGAGLLRALDDGRVVRCIPGEPFCRDMRAGPVESTLPAFHDLDVSAWGFGEGVHVVAQARARSSLGGGRALWPRGDDAFDLMAAYVDVERTRLRLRAGRQWKVSGLGYYNFDGVAAAVRAAPDVWVELYGGQSLVRGLNEPRASGALEAIEPLSPPAPGVLAGVHARYRPSPRAAFSATYQVDVQRDRQALDSELAAASAVIGFGGATMEMNVEADVAAGALNEARMHLRAPPVRNVALFADARRYRPYFELWTIWGAFSPIGFDELRGGATWADATGRLVVRGEGAYRAYGNSQRAEAPDPLTGDGWALAAGAGWNLTERIRADGSVRAEHGVGAARRDAQLGVVHRLGESVTVSLGGVLFERLYEFRLAEGSVAGLTAEAAFPVWARARAVVAASAFRHLGRGSTSGFDWNQRRASVRLQWTAGAEP